MRNKIRVSLAAFTMTASLVSVVQVNAQSRLSRPSDHMQTGGVDYTDDMAVPTATTPPPLRMQTATMDNATFQAGAGQNMLRSGAQNNGMNAPLSASADTSNPMKKLHNFLVGGSRQLSGAELANLGRHDVVLLIDKSSSMAEQDCLSMDRRWGMISRWDWCREQTTDLAQQAGSVLKRGISVVLFSWSAMVFPHVDVNQIPRIFTDNHPDGKTREASALATILDDYFQRRATSRGKVAPLLVAVITDGRPDSESEVRKKIIEATRNMQSPDEIRITFLLVGQDPRGLQFIQEMDRDLTAQGAKFDIVSSRPFHQLVKTGLAAAMCESLSEPQEKPNMMDALNFGKHKNY
jgi:hypothetical protein